MAAKLGESTLGMLIVGDEGNLWITPKTNWKSTDYFNAEDYNRIIGNLMYLKKRADELFYNVSEVTEKEEKDYTSYIYAKEINVIESEIENLNKTTYLLDIGKTKKYKNNGNVPDYNEYNRIEGFCWKIYNELKYHKENLPRLAFRLGE